LDNSIEKDIALHFCIKKGTARGIGLFECNIASLQSKNVLDFTLTLVPVYHKRQNGKDKVLSQILYSNTKSTVTPREIKENITLSSSKS
jgi:hypothetical protein